MILIMKITKKPDASIFTSTEAESSSEEGNEGFESPNVKPIQVSS